MSAESTPRVLSFDEFRRLVAQELDIATELVVPEASFLDDLQADSIQLFGLLLRFEEMGMAIPLEAAWQIRTVKDAYEMHVESIRGSQGVQKPPLPLGDNASPAGLDNC
jgi:acyl carrier protein